MGLFGKRKDDTPDPTVISADEALKLAREGMAKSGTYFNSSGQRRKLSAEQRAQMDGMFDRLEAAHAKAAAAQPPAPPTAAAVAGAAAGADDQLSRLERLVALRDSGALTDEEFGREKARIIGSS